jgi:hypothetical protein
VGFNPSQRDECRVYVTLEPGHLDQAAYGPPWRAIGSGQPMQLRHCRLLALRQVRPASSWRSPPSRRRLVSSVRCRVETSCRAACTRMIQSSCNRCRRGCRGNEVQRTAPSRAHGRGRVPAARANDLGRRGGTNGWIRLGVAVQLAPRRKQRPGDKNSPNVAAAAAPLSYPTASPGGEAQPPPLRV